MEKWTEDQLAYDGSCRKQDRELTPRERDIMVRILGDIFSTIRRTGNLDSLMFSDGLGGIRMDAEEIPLLVEVRHVIDPREV